MEDRRKQELEHSPRTKPRQRGSRQKHQKTPKTHAQTPISHVFLDHAPPLGWNPSTPPHTQRSTHHSRPHSTPRHPYAFHASFHTDPMPGKRTPLAPTGHKNSARTDTPQCRRRRHSTNARREPPTLNQSAYEQERAPTNPTTHTTPHYSTDRTKIASSDQCTYPTRRNTQSPPP